MDTKAKKISTLSYSLFSIMLTLYLAFEQDYIISSMFFLFSILFVIIYVALTKNDINKHKIIENNSKHLSLNVGFMITWLIIYVIDLKNNFAAFEHLQYLLIGGTIFVMFSYIIKFTRKNKSLM